MWKNKQSEKEFAVQHREWIAIVAPLIVALFPSKKMDPSSFNNNNNNHVVGNHTGNHTGHHTGHHIPAGGEGGGGGVENEFMKEELHNEGLVKGRQRLDSPTSIATHIYSTNIGINDCQR